jgi:hypothetical protein
MTEYEIRDALSGLYAQTTTDATTVFSLITAYLVAAYLVGHELPRKQLIIVNCLFGSWVTMAIYAVKSSLEQAADLVRRAAEQQFAFVDSMSVAAQYFFSWAFPLILLAGGLAAFYFMWTVRHPKNG